MRFSWFKFLIQARNWMHILFSNLNFYLNFRCFQFLANFKDSIIDNYIPFRSFLLISYQHISAIYAACARKWWRAFWLSGSSLNQATSYFREMSGSVRGMPWPLNWHNLLHCTVRTSRLRSYNQGIDCLLYVI